MASMRTLLGGLGSLAAALLAIPILILSVPFVLMARNVRLVARLLEPAFSGMLSLVEYAPILGWRPRAGIQPTHYLIENDDFFPRTADPKGFPGQRAIHESKIIVLGDSFAYGYGARSGEAYFDIASDLYVKPIACIGYDMVQELLLLKQMASEFSGKLVIWWIYPENDLPDNLRPYWRDYRKPFVRQKGDGSNWEIVSSHVRKGKWRHSIGRPNLEAFANLCTPGAFSERHYSACEFLLSEGLAECTRNGIELAVMTIPSMNQLHEEGCRRLATHLQDPALFDPEYPDKKISSICQKLGISFHTLMPDLKWTDYKPFEKYHWVTSGHRIAARAIRTIANSRRKPDGQILFSGGEESQRPPSVSLPVESLDPVILNPLGGDRSA